MTSRPPTEARISREIERVLDGCLPPDWKLRAQREQKVGRFVVDLLVELAPPADEAAVLVIEIKRSIEPRDLQSVGEQVTASANAVAGGVPVVASAFLSPRTRELADELGVSYVDTTGNVKLQSKRPGLYVSAVGANRDPWPQSGELQSLKGRGAGRAVRAIVDTTPPFGVRELAARTGASPATISRVLDLLDRDNLVRREPRGAVLSVDWAGVIRRWTQDYAQMETNAASTFLEPRGLPSLSKTLRTSKVRYAATGAFAVQQFDPIAPARVAALYVDDVVKAAEQLKLRPADTGSNVVLLEPFDGVVFDRTSERDGLRCVGASQLAVDLLTGPGREPTQGEEFLDWMGRNQRAWQS